MRVTAGSGNVFADMGLPDPEEELSKAQLACHIRRVIARRRLMRLHMSLNEDVEDHT